MPVNSGQSGKVEQQIYDYITKVLKYNTASACGILANIEAESGFNPSAKGDYDKSGVPHAYGLCQWNYRREDLFSYTKTKTPTVEKQMAFMKHELDTSFKSTRSILSSVSNTSEGARSAAYEFCVNYEIPANKVSKGHERGARAATAYWNHWSKPENVVDSSIAYVDNIGVQIVEIAMSCVGKPYVRGGIGPGAFDESGLIYYCYDEAGYHLKHKSPQGYYDEYKDKAKSVTLDNVAPGDLLFYEKFNGVRKTITSVAIADGIGGRIEMPAVHREVTHSTGLNNPTYVLRILSDAETGAYGTGGGYDDVSMDAVDYTHLTNIDPYASIMEQNLSSVHAEGYDYGYLIDMDHGGEFRFYIPEFTEQAGANWGDVDIRGRSVTVKEYNSTSSRSISITLDLYAGVGVYTATSTEDGPDTVSRMHKDAFFVKSLEYPDYSTAVVAPPPTVHLILGSAINIIGVVSGVSVEHKKPLDAQNRAMYITLSFTVTQTAKNPIDYKDVREGQYSVRSSSSADTIPGVVTNAPVYSAELEEFGVGGGSSREYLDDFGVGGSNNG